MSAVSLKNALDALESMVEQYAQHDGRGGPICDTGISAVEDAIRVLKAHGRIEWREPPPRPMNWFQTEGCEPRIQRGWYFTGPPWDAPADGHDEGTTPADTRSSAGR